MQISLALVAVSYYSGLPRLLPSTHGHLQQQQSIAVPYLQTIVRSSKYNTASKCEDGAHTDCIWQVRVMVSFQISLLLLATPKGQNMRLQSF
jgi:hypothetical protein